MTKVICPLFDCMYWEDGMCGAQRIRLSDEGYCVTFKISEDDEPAGPVLPSDEWDELWEEEENPWDEEEDFDEQVF